VGLTARARMTVVPARAFWWFAATYVVLVLAGRATAVVDRSPSLVWPAAGAGFLWLVARRGPRWGAWALGGIGGLVLVLQWATGGSTGLVLAGAASAVVQASVAVALVRRHLPDLLGAGGHGTIATPRALSAFVAVTVCATGAGTLAAVVVFLAASEPLAPTAAALWWGRNLAGMLLVGASGHVLVHTLVTGGLPRLPARRLVELTLVAACGATALVVTQHLDRGQPLAFLAIATSVWCALRFPTVVAALQVVVTGAVGFALAVGGPTPAAPPGPIDALVVQAFVITLLLVTLAIGSSRDERATVLAELEVARQVAGDRARFLETVTDVMAEGLVVLDADANLVQMNAAAREILDLTPVGTSTPTTAGDYVVTSADGTILAPHEHPSVRAIHEGRVGPEDVVLVLGDGTRRTLSVTADALQENGVATGSVVVYRDVTRERRQADQLAEFAATAAHDLRSPLAALGGWIEMAAETSEPPARVALDRARSAAARMQDLIADLLDQASAEGALLSSAELEAVPLDLVVDEVAGYLPDHAVVVRAELPAVEAHPEMLRQLLSNLLGNAVKYVEPGLVPQVTVTARRVGDRVVVEVADNGIGVPEDERDRVFERLHRAHANDPRYTGTGLGLAICRTIVLRHGGHIECREAPGGGTVLAFDLPAAVPEVPTVAPPVDDREAIPGH